MGRNHTGPPCSVGRPTAHAAGPAATVRPRAQRPAAGSVTDDADRRQTTDASEQNNTGSFGGPVINIHEFNAWECELLTMQLVLLDDCMRWCVAMVVAAATGCDYSSAWARLSAVVTWRRPSHCVWSSVWRLFVALGNSQWQWRLPLSSALLLAAADTKYKQIQWALAEQRWSSKLRRYLMVSY